MKHRPNIGKAQPKTGCAHVNSLACVGKTAETAESAEKKIEIESKNKRLSLRDPCALCG